MLKGGGRGAVSDELNFLPLTAVACGPQLAAGGGQCAHHTHVHVYLWYMNKYMYIGSVHRSDQWRYCVLTGLGGELY